MSAVLDSKLEMLLSSSSFWLWGGPFPVVLVYAAALLVYLGDQWRNEPL